MIQLEQQQHGEFVVGWGWINLIFYSNSLPNGKLVEVGSVTVIILNQFYILTEQLEQ